MRKMILALAGALALVAAPAMAAGGEGGSWEAGAYAGYAWLDDYSTLLPDDDTLIGVRMGYFFSASHSVEASFQQVATTLESGEDLDLDSLRVNYLMNYREGKMLRPFWTIGAGAEFSNTSRDPNTTLIKSSSTDMSVNAGGGLRLFLSDWFQVRLDGRYVFSEMGGDVDDSVGNVEGSVGFAFSWGGGPPPDADNDGVRDSRDNCPDTPVGARVDLTGCPIDSDGDGVFDGIDRCSKTPSGWPVDEVGCPLDSDGDGVPDGADNCADTPQGATVDDKGCPSDSDGDGVLDGLDRCPDTPQGATVDEKGCPLDADHDGVYDGIDECPDTRLTETVDAKGCPDKPKAEPLFEMDEKVLVLEGVNFEVNEAAITPESTETLEKVAASLADWPEVKIEIGGHTDSSGTRAHNLDLSQRRAEAVKAYLVGKGIDESRMTTMGYGEDRPIADNDSDEGKAKNRRVELTRID